MNREDFLAFGHLQGVDGVEIVHLRSSSDLRSLLQSNATALRAAYESAVLNLNLPLSLRAKCGCCDKIADVEVSARHANISPRGSINIAFSETGVCKSCLVSSRMRFACDIIRPQLNAQKRVYLAEKKTNLFASLQRQGFDVVGSEFLGFDKEPGVDYDGVEHQDIHRLTFSDASFDAFLCLDVLEHVNDPLAGVLELHRLLKPGGVGIVTVPFFDRPESVIRTRMKEGDLEYLLPAEYHGNPLGGGSLVFRELGWDFIESIQRELGPERVQFINYWSLYRAHFGRYRFAIVLNA